MLNLHPSLKPRLQSPGGIRLLGGCRFVIVIGLGLLFILDWMFFGGTITYLLLSLISRGRGGGSGGGGFGGGSGGGGGSSLAGCRIKRRHSLEGRLFACYGIIK